ncbi:hypothetical protein [Paenibacillus guangzhouensis]|uniref:hypothetical protein n=1 Tax=Paenibacillus guangzhouensis TaxID=1473112 RepID=UPI001267331F|nr:hypothetical protein [Paenibacillus guangzhouensis]
MSRTMTPSDIRDFCKQNVGNRVNVELQDGTGYTGHIVMATTTMFSIRYRHHGRTVITKILFNTVDYVEAEPY